MPSREIAGHAGGMHTIFIGLCVDIDNSVGKRVWHPRTSDAARRLRMRRYRKENREEGLPAIRLCRSVRHRRCRAIRLRYVEREVEDIYLEPGQQARKIAESHQKNSCKCVRERVNGGVRRADTFDEIRK